jgi:hypothetical protein
MQPHLRSGELHTGESTLARKIIHAWWTECSECGGNADLTESMHLRGGRVPGQNNPTRNWIDTSKSSLSHLNGCLAEFDEPDEQAWNYNWPVRENDER